MDCRYCGQSIIVPEATPERIERAENLLRDQPDFIVTPMQPTPFDHPLSEREINALARKATYLPLDQMDFSGYPIATIPSRILACIVDQCALLICVAMGLLGVVWLAKCGWVEDPLATWRTNGTLSTSAFVLMNSLSMMLVVGQWLLLSTSGQTIGKKLMMIRVVTTEGQVPGFMRAVVLRNWVRNLLYLIPMSWLVDYLFILGESKRAGHDWISCTKVVALA
jgi:uncharacterized RDD family membrane protein YckC